MSIQKQISVDKIQNSMSIQVIALQMLNKGVYSTNKSFFGIS